MAGSNFGKGISITQAERKNLSQMTEVQISEVSEAKDGVSGWIGRADVNDDTYVDTILCAHISFKEKFTCTADLKPPKRFVKPEKFDIIESGQKMPPKKIYVGDIDGDGDADLAVELSDGNIRVYHNRLKAPKSVMDFLKKIADKTPAAEQQRIGALQETHAEHFNKNEVPPMIKYSHTWWLYVDIVDNKGSLNSELARHVVDTLYRIHNNTTDKAEKKGALEGLSAMEKQGYKRARNRLNEITKKK